MNLEIRTPSDDIYEMGPTRKDSPGHEGPMGGIGANFTGGKNWGRGDLSSGDDLGLTKFMEQELWQSTPGTKEKAATPKAPNVNVQFESNLGIRVS